MNEYKELEEVYSSLNILRIPLHAKCKYSLKCWAGVGMERKCNDGEVFAQLYLPYIGKHYSAGKILALGINLHEYGGHNAEIELAEIAIDEISLGKKKTFAHDGYTGSLVWHRFLSYAAFILREYNIKKPNERPYPGKEELVNAFDYFSVTNSVKCCPWGERSKPTAEMWNHCPSFILKEEIRILKPKHIIVLGLDNFVNIESVFKITNTTVDGNVKLIDAVFEDYELKIYVIPHPSSSQGTSICRMDGLERLLIKDVISINKQLLRSF